MTVLDHVRRPATGRSLTVKTDRHKQWHAWYVPAAGVLDFLVGVVAGVVALVVRFGAEASPVYWAASLLLPVVWVATLAAHRLYESRFLGTGAEEFRRIYGSGLHLAAFVAIAAYATKTDFARGYVALAIPLAVVLDVLARHLLRKRLHRERKAGRSMQRVVAVGHAEDVVALEAQLSREKMHGLQVVGACVYSSSQVDTLLAQGIPAIGGFENVIRAVELCQADTVAVVSSPQLQGDDLRRLSWKLETSNTSLVVSPGIVEVGGPRLTIRPAAGLSLLHVEHPVLSGGRQIIKSVLDRGLALAGLLVLTPVLGAVALLVRMTSEGPVIYRQQRVGVRGKEFTIWKFRTMYADADQRLAELLAQNEHDGVLFKIRKDPRITRVGAALRRYSLDELPQLVNVLLGHMSLVGPRPPLPQEVAQYPEHAHRRLLVKPGLTGLWQVSGRSDLSWEESLRLDLRYVDNWSLALDLMVMWKTGRAVLKGSGAY